ncbi:hypothetical protein TTHERM_00448590 (macronuclear) [Tetrahymena thermophila SB210]|uniref:Uncharacterized protein n=1 Tax=Tetrahymena thermophila (strain SB210) TaxID=312017 RepID=Q239F5_TETTS|nr:hypothetical protein TTHERM_00448590 [Tetrahymena thermophila SB210]EAR93015.2 hypothetical protein TTHERM_00448590 [Tetrahymena thermophila SB210]|eukprot:XP_001013260.2 hypothetical protein TTHERM_00448590 [Tetrahymena thermophila SB210]
MNLLLFDYNKAFLQVYDTFEEILKTHIITDNVRPIDQVNLIGHLNESFREFYLQNVYSNYTEFLIAYLAMIRSRPSKQILIKVCSDFILNWQKQVKKCCDLQIFLYIIYNSKDSKKLFEIYYYIRKTLFSYQTELYRNNPLDMLQYDFEEANRLFKSLFSSELCKAICSRFVMLIQKHQKTVYKGNVMKGNFIAEFVLHEYLELKEKQPELMKEVIIHNRMLVKEQNKYEFRKRFKINESIIDYSPQQTGKNQGNKKFVLDLSILNQQKLGVETQIQSQNQFANNSNCNGQECEHQKQIEILLQRESQLVSQNGELKQSNQKIQKQLLESMVEVEQMKSKFEQMKNLTENLIQKQALSVDNQQAQESQIIQQQVNNLSKEFDEIQVSVKKKIQDQAEAKASQKQQFKKLKLNNSNLEQNFDLEVNNVDNVKDNFQDKNIIEVDSDKGQKNIKQAIKQSEFIQNNNQEETNGAIKSIQLFQNKKNIQKVELEKDQNQKNDQLAHQAAPQTFKQNQNSFLKLSQVSSDESFIKIKQTESTLTVNNIIKYKPEENSACKEGTQNEGYIKESIVYKQAENRFNNNIQFIQGQKPSEESTKNQPQSLNYQIKMNNEQNKIIENPSLEMSESPHFKFGDKTNNKQQQNDFNENSKKAQTLADSSSISSSIEDIYINQMDQSVVNQNKDKEIQQNNPVKQLNLFQRGNNNNNSKSSQIQQEALTENSLVSNNKSYDINQLNQVENNNNNYDKKIDKINEQKNNIQTQNQPNINSQNQQKQISNQRKSLQKNQESAQVQQQFEVQNDQSISRNPQDKNYQQESRSSSLNSKVQQDSNQQNWTQKQPQQSSLDNNQTKTDQNQNTQSIYSSRQPPQNQKNQDQQFQNQKMQQDQKEKFSFPTFDEDNKYQFSVNTKNTQISNRNYSPSFNSDHFHVQSVGNSNDQNQQPKNSSNNFNSIKQYPLFDISQNMRSNSSNDSQNHQSIKSSSFNEDIGRQGSQNNSKYSDNNTIINQSQQNKSRGSQQTEKISNQLNEIQFTQSSSNSQSQISYAKSKESLQGNFMDNVKNQQQNYNIQKDQTNQSQYEILPIPSQFLQNKQQQQADQQYKNSGHQKKMSQIDDQVKLYDANMINKSQQQNHKRSGSANLPSQINNQQQLNQIQYKQNNVDSQSRQAKDSFKLENVGQQFTFDIPEEEEIADENSESSAYQSKEKQENLNRNSKNISPHLNQSSQIINNIQKSPPAKKQISPESSQRQNSQYTQRYSIQVYPQNQNTLNDKNSIKNQQNEAFVQQKSNYIERTPENLNKIRDLQSSSQKSDIQSSHSPYRKSMYANFPTNQLSSGFKSSITNTNSNQILQYSATSNHSNKQNISRFDCGEDAFVNQQIENQNNISSYNPLSNNQQANQQQKNAATPSRNSQQIQNYNQTNQNGQRNSMLNSQNNRSVLTQKNERNSILDNSQLSDNKSRQSYIITVQDSINEINNSRDNFKGNTPSQKLTNILQDIDSPMVANLNNNIIGNYQLNDQPTFEGALSKYGQLKQNKLSQQNQQNQVENKSFDQQSEQDDVERQSDIWLRDSVIQNEEEQSYLNKRDSKSQQAFGPFKMTMSTEQSQDLRQSIPKPIFYGVPIQFSQTELLRKN